MKINHDVEMTLLFNFRCLLPILVVTFLSKTILRKLWREQSNNSPLNSACNWLKFSSKNHSPNKQENWWISAEAFWASRSFSEKSRSYSRKTFGNTGIAITTSSTYNMFKLVYTVESLVKSRLVSPSVSTIICIDTCHENSNVSSMSKNIKFKCFWHYT